MQTSCYPVASYLHDSDTASHLWGEASQWTRYNCTSCIVLIAWWMCVGCHFTLRGVNYMNNSVIPISEIGTELTNSTSEALQCITDLRPCCRQSEASAIQQMLMGEWYYPDGTRVPDNEGCLLYTSPSPRDATLSRMPSSA